MITFDPTNLIKNLQSSIKCIINTKPENSVQIISQLIVNGKTHQDDQEMANVFNNFLVNVSNQVCSGISRTRDPMHPILDAGPAQGRLMG